MFFQLRNHRHRNRNSNRSSINDNNSVNNRHHRQEDVIEVQQDDNATTTMNDVITNERSSLLQHERESASRASRASSSNGISNYTNNTTSNSTGVTSASNNNSSISNTDSWNDISDIEHHQTDNDRDRDRDTPANNENDNDNDNDTPNENDNENQLQVEILTLTNRLRILFFTLTLPIIPLGLLLTLFTLQLSYTSVTSPSCSPNHPLKLYTLLTIFMSIYTPNHKMIRSYLFNYDRSRDGNVRPTIVRIYDQCYHIGCVWYVYYGMMIVQNCNDDLVDVIMTTTTSTTTDPSIIESTTASSTMNKMESICTVSCPDLFSTLVKFVLLLKIFFIVLLLPLICLPFVYFWIMRRLRTEEAWIRFGRAVNGNGTGDGDDDDRIVYAKEVMENLKDVILVPVRGGDGFITTTGSAGDDDSFQRVRIVKKKDGGDHHDQCNHDEEDPLLDHEHTDDEKDVRDWDAVKDCCICMSEFGVTHDDITNGNIPNSSNRIKANRSLNNDSNKNLRRIENQDSSTSNENPFQDLAIIQTKCGHIFHKRCIQSWIGGNWSEDVSIISSTATVRAQRRRCPLCREDLAPPVDS